MTVYVLHVIDQDTNSMLTRSLGEPHQFDYIYEVLAGPQAGLRGTMDELSRRVFGQLTVVSSKVGVCQQTGALLDWVGTFEVGRWERRHERLAEREVGSSY